jgi:molybdopterin-guanine dinucleotide biosynthesis protein B
VARVIEHLSGSGLRVGALKHSSHGFQMDREGKDTYRFREAGAYAVGIASSTERAVIATTDEPTSLADLAATLPAALDIVVVEGYKAEGAPKIEVHRRGQALMSVPAQAANLIAVVTEDVAAFSDSGPTDADWSEQIPVFDRDDVAGICGFLRARFLG